MVDNKELESVELCVERARLIERLREEEKRLDTARHDVAAAQSELRSIREGRKSPNLPPKPKAPARVKTVSNVGNTSSVFGAVTESWLKIIGKILLMFFPALILLGIVDAIVHLGALQIVFLVLFWMGFAYLFNKSQFDMMFAVARENKAVQERYDSYKQTSAANEQDYLQAVDKYSKDMEKWEADCARAKENAINTLKSQISTLEETVASAYEQKSSTEQSIRDTEQAITDLGIIPPAFYETAAKVADQVRAGEDLLSLLEKQVG